MHVEVDAQSNTEKGYWVATGLGNIILKHLIDSRELPRVEDVSRA